MFHKLGSSLIVYTLLNILVFGLFFYLNRLLPYLPEEIVGWGYSRLDGTRILNINSAIENANYIYLNHIGRYIPAILTSLFLINTTKLIFDLINSILFLFIINLFTLSFESKSLRNFIFVFSLGIFVLITPNFIGTVVWMLASVEYFWSGVLTVLIIFLINSKLINNTFIKITTFFLIVITASMTEIAGLSLFIYLNVRLFASNEFQFSNYLKLDKSKVFNIFFIIGSFIGTLIVVLSPGGFNRITGDEGGLTLLRLAFTSVRILYYYLMSFYFALTIIILQLSLMYKQFNSINKIKGHYKFLTYLLTAIIPIIPLALSSGFSLRILFIPGLFLILSILELTKELLKSDLRTRTGYFLAFSSLISIFALVTFIFNQIYMLQNVDARMVERDLYWFVEEANEFNWRDD